MAHRKRFVTSREIWTLYCLMIGAGVFWGTILSLIAFRMFHFNHEALAFLGFLTTTTGVLAGSTTYAASRRLLIRVETRARNADLDIS